MLINDIKQATFEKSTYEEWQDVAVKSLKGLPFEKLISKTVEGINLYPLYTEHSSRLGSLDPIRDAKQRPGWTIAQQQYTDDAHSFLQSLRESIERGNESIVYDGSNPINWHDDVIIELAKLAIQYPIYFYRVSKTDEILNVFSQISGEDKKKVTGVVETEQTNLLEGFVNVRTVGADVIEAHHSGADAVTELALALAKAAHHANDIDSFKTLNEQFFVRFAIDTHFFMEIAKLRAFRVLWEALSVAYSKEDVEHIPILSETSMRSYATLDPYVNLLRAGNSAFSAILGGTDVLTVHPHDVLINPTPTSIRLARNVQLVIKAETQVTEVIDPSSGSYFIESLTKELVEKAWQLFVEIEELGGYSTYINSNAYSERLEKLYTERIESISKGTHSLVGTNVYADLGASDEKEAKLSVRNRLAEPFEKFRMLFEKDQPKIGLLTFGELKDFKPRADFISGFLATGGLETKWSSELSTVDEAIDWVNGEQLNYIIICATNKVTQELMIPLLEKLPCEITTDVAGKYDDELSKQWIEKGLNGFVYKGLDKLEKFTEILSRWKGDADIEKT